MPLEEQLRLLSMVDILEPLSREELREMAKRSPDTHLRKGAIFFRPQDKGEKLYVLKKGRVQIYDVTVEGNEVSLLVVEEGNIFGEMILTGQNLSGVYARALEPSVVCHLRRSDLEQIILNHPEVGLRLVRCLSERLREFEVRLSEIASKSVTARVASLILRLEESQGVVTREGALIPTRYTHERLGTMIGARRVAVTRAFNLLRQAGAVELKQRYIHIRDRKALEHIAAGGV